MLPEKYFNEYLSVFRIDQGIETGISGHIRAVPEIQCILIPHRFVQKPEFPVCVCPYQFLLVCQPDCHIAYRLTGNSISDDTTNVICGAGIILTFKSLADEKHNPACQATN